MGRAATGGRGQKVHRVGTNAFSSWAEQGQVRSASGIFIAGLMPLCCGQSNDRWEGLQGSLSWVGIGVGVERRQVWMIQCFLKVVLTQRLGLGQNGDRGLKVWDFLTTHL